MTCAGAFGGATLPDGRIPVLISAHSHDLVAKDAAALLRFLDTDCGRAASVADIATHLLRTRRIRRHRSVIRAADRAELRAALDAVAHGAEHRLVSGSSTSRPPRVAFVFPGQGGQHPGMGADAHRRLPGYRAAVDECAAAFAAAGHASPLRYLTEIDAPESFSEIEIQGAQFAHAVGLAAAWRSHGVAPDLAVGHSLGEIAAAYVAGAMGLADAVTVVAVRAGVVDRLTGRYAVAALGITADAARDLIEDIGGWLELSVINASAAVAVSGDADAVAAAVERVRADGRLGTPITVNFPVHTSVLEPLRGWVQDHLPAASFAETAVQFIGGTTGAVVAPGTGFVDYWYANLRNTVRFDRAVQAAIDCGATIFVELSSHPALLHAVAERAGEAVLAGTGHRDHPLPHQLAANIAAVAVADPTFIWRELTPSTGAALRGFPNAPMRAGGLWAQREPLAPVTGLTVTAESWVPMPTPATRGRPSVAVVTLGGATSLVHGLHTVLGDVMPSDAEILVAVAPDLADTDVPEAAAALAKLVQAGLLRYVDQIGPSCRQVWLVTIGAEQTGVADPVPSPVAAALAAVHRSLGFERPDQAFHHLDTVPGVAAEVVLDVVRACGGELALRHVDGRPQLYRRDPKAFTTSGVTAPDLALDGGLLDDVVITGAAGAIGLQYARHLAERGARRIVLLSRRAVDPAVCAALSETHGTEVVAVPCDITDAGQLSAAAAQFGGQGASLVVHCAGLARFGTAQDLDTAAFIQTLSAKVVGAVRLAQIWPHRPESRMLLCSSMSGVWGGHGHAAYAAANRMLDIVAHQVRATGRRCVSVRWGLWGDGGIVDAAEIANIERSGLRQMPAEAAIAASLRDHAVDPLVLSADTERLRMFLDSLDAPVPAVEHGAAAADRSTADTVRAELAAVLSLPDPGVLDLNESLFDLGVDSLLALDLRKRLHRVMGRTVGLARLLGGITGAELVSDLERK
ncbi:mycobactin polyketide synthase MbtD [Mycobacterium sp. ACS4331]|uniref:mycobactin polyketide synthase MbtD n=1 Tax=Mycobacterium sp. ACS4331 TaxID=1834121 RepID=UPI0007FCF4EC|nr:mycobactin polyketide synthase MbtD [Mycobacterium sp. ACS4331]OBF11848.1 polyketide synthase [Mycobacterium sp. ACS4331]